MLYEEADRKNMRQKQKIRQQGAIRLRLVQVRDKSRGEEPVNE